MSNYSDFFGVGSSGGGGGMPVNSYAPFLVSSTGVPPGYDATTGLYTHPNGEYWLRSGNVVGDASGAYPDATALFQATGRQNTSATSTYGAKSADQFWNGSSLQNITHTLYDWTGATISSFTTNTIVGSPYTSAQQAQPVYDRTNDYVWVFYFMVAGASPRRVIQSYNAATGALGYNDVVGFAPANNDRPLGAAAEINAGTATPLVAFGRDNGYDVFDVTDPLNPTTIASPGLPAAVNNSRALPSPTADCIYIANDGINFTEYNYLTGATGNTFSYNSERIYAWDTQYTGATAAQYWSNTPVIVSEVANTVGDPTARTDTDTSQPLFLRIK